MKQVHAIATKLDKLGKASSLSFEIISQFIRKHNEEIQPLIQEYAKINMEINDENLSEDDRDKVINALFTNKFPMKKISGLLNLVQH